MLSASMVTGLTLPSALPMIGVVVVDVLVLDVVVVVDVLVLGVVVVVDVLVLGVVVVVVSVDEVLVDALVETGVSTTLSTLAMAPRLGRPTSLMVSPALSATLLMVKLVMALPSG